MTVIAYDDGGRSILPLTFDEEHVVDLNESEMEALNEAHRVAIENGFIDNIDPHSEATDVELNRIVLSLIWRYTGSSGTTKSAQAPSLMNLIDS